MSRVVVVGNGMVGSRFAADLVEGDGGRFRVTVLGAEGPTPYNRVLLSQVVAGRYDPDAIGLPSPDPERVSVRAGTVAVAVDREDRSVLASDGSRHRYDFLVLATGAAARVPDLAGADPAPEGLHTLRTLEDARAVVAATREARRAVVLGAGVLGVETAVALSRRGLAVTVVHPSSLMDRQLDRSAAEVLAAGMDRLGIAHRSGVRASRVLSRQRRVSGLALADGSTLEAELLVLCVGTVPETDLARAAGLPVRRGVVVDEHLASPADRRVFAVGDCAEPPEGASGLIAQGWEQAARLVARLRATGTGTGALPPRRDRVADDVVTLKAEGLDVVTMGVTGDRTRDPSLRTLQLSDPGAGRHVQVVVSGERLVGATCLGDPEVAAELLTTYTRGAPVPSDPARLLLTALASTAGPAAAVTDLPEEAVVCRCNGVTRGAIEHACRQGARTLEQVAARTRASTGCGGCRADVCALLAARPAPSPTPLDDCEDSVTTVSSLASSAVTSAS
ncbi:FAD-dependent oxidoreductase [Auraticoccus monumenti]|uniref:Assimilatory nitrate reductase (NADH) beta subunit n=1 Tax=Auraticoccus monumenti TaxID=675864 RepID=A0A1G7DI25_9ACTN|nr:FAD-dependent oxidoreductase [Auraticoccus monumenti]SDE51218.1 assimilatory nitrate reductase (NADH) beta subunit [Auraticoccus monumenti]